MLKNDPLKILLFGRWHYKRELSKVDIIDEKRIWHLECSDIRSCLLTFQICINHRVCHVIWMDYNPAICTIGFIL